MSADRWDTTTGMGKRWIDKVGLAAVVGGRLLVVRKHGDTMFILPGGKREGDESDLEALTRELDEELGVGVAEAMHLKTFKDVAAGVKDAVVVVRLYAGQIVGVPTPRAEITEYAWIDLRRADVPLAPSIANQILPFLRTRNSGRASRAKVADKLIQGSLKIR